MSNPASSNSSNCPAINTMNPAAVQIVHRAPFHDGYFTCLKFAGCMCMCMDRVRNRTYLNIMENKIESNYPGCGFASFFNLLRCKVEDAVGVVYLDSAKTTTAARAGVCSPGCTHCSCFPDCCGICGQTLIIYSPGMCGGLCCRSWVPYPGLEDAEGAAAAINQARANLGSRQIQPGQPGPQTMGH